MANDEVLGPRKTMFVLVIVVGCFAVLWPRILSPLVVGNSADHIKPNKLDRDAGCCEVIFETEVAVLQLVDEVCGAAHSALECRKLVNDTCGVDIAAFLKRTDNVGKTTKMLVEAMRSSNSSCLRQNFGVPVYSMGAHFAVDSNYQQDILKQERPPIRIGQHPALLERGRAIPPGPPPASRPVVLPPHVRVKSPLSVYYEPDIKPPPIPGMRPPLGSAGGPHPAPKSSMGFVMPIYTICIIVFFVYTLSKILFKRSGTPYEPVAPDPHFRRRVFRDDSRTSPDKLGHKETDTIVSAISGLVAEVTQQMEAGQQTHQRQEMQDNARPYTNGTIIHSGPVQIVASEYREKTPEPKKQKEFTPEIEEVVPLSKDVTSEPKKDVKDEIIELIENETAQMSKELAPENVVKDEILELIENETAEMRKEYTPEKDVKDEILELIENETTQMQKESTPEKDVKDEILELIENETAQMSKESAPEKEIILVAEKENKLTDINKQNDTEDIANIEQINDSIDGTKDLDKEIESMKKDDNKELETSLFEEILINDQIENVDQIQIDDANKKENVAKSAEFLNDERKSEEAVSTEDLLEEAIKDLSEEDIVQNQDNQSVKVVGTEVTAHAADGGSYKPEPPKVTPQTNTHEAEEVTSIFLQTEIPQQSRVLVADFAEERPTQEKRTHSPLVVSGKITLSLIQDAPRDTPDRDLESTVDEFTTASAYTQPPAEKEDDMEGSDEEIEEEIEIEEIEEEEEEEDGEVAQKDVHK